MSTRHNLISYFTILSVLSLSAYRSSLNTRGLNIVCSFRKRIGEGLDEAPGSGSGAQRFQHILHLASSSGEFEKVSQVTRYLTFILKRSTVEESQTFIVDDIMMSLDTRSLPLSGSVWKLPVDAREGPQPAERVRGPGLAGVLGQVEPRDHARAELLPDEIPALPVRHIPLPVCPRARAPHQLSPQPARGTPRLRAPDDEDDEETLQITLIGKLKQILNTIYDV